ncbi:TrmH family RNA methyltransferase [Paenibacillus sp. J2TS4]|uniref:TrmH family RNA methyltransferase n=1 Tax=Paenibacillus sp. J2TS4 TaxID=2807194 RepID=UPI001B2F40C3|nr:TrmH family RNA methyltransferase [Paenibacillus sp. J2TS4]GIP35348.1 rRNA methyltransferase [Paenibacillus sp. J2TS4]
MPTIVDIYSENNDYQKFEVLKRKRNKRHKYNEFFVEGVRNINEAINNNWEINGFVYSKHKKLSSWGANIIANSNAKFHYELHGELMGKLSDKEETSELIAIASIPEDDISRIQVQEPMLVVVFDRPSSRGNLGTIIRSCDALGAQGLIITGHAVDLYDPETIRASMGSLFNLPTIRISSPLEIQRWVLSLRETFDVQIVGTSARGKKELYYADFSKPTILLIGNETDGLCHKYKEMCDSTVRIPIGGSASSMNVACATSIILYEINRQRSLGY